VRKCNQGIPKHKTVVIGLALIHLLVISSPTFSIVPRSNQTVAFDAATPTSKTLGDAAFTVITTASSGLTPTLGSSTPSVCTVLGNTVTLIATGTCILTADQAGDHQYNPAPQVKHEISVFRFAIPAQDIPVFGPVSLLAVLLGLLWFGNRRRQG